MEAAIYTEDLFSDVGITEPYQRYREIRDLGAAVWLPREQVYAVGRYNEVRQALGDHETFISGQGVMINEQVNEMSRGTTVASDPPLHDHLRQVVAHRLTPRALREQRSHVDSRAATVVDSILRHGGDVVDAVTLIAQPMPMAVVPDFLGFPEECRPHLLTWAKAAADLGGPVSNRTPVAAERAAEMVAYIAGLTRRRGVLPDSLGDDVLKSADAGIITAQQCPSLLLDYFGPSLETTVSAISSAIALFSQNPDQWDKVRADPALLSGAFNEAIRLESPIRGFSRVAARETELGGVDIPAGARVLLLFGSANRDERKWDRPDEFDVTRANADHLALGHGLHGCAGQGLARLEFGTLMTRLAAEVARFEPAGEPRMLVNNTTRAYEKLPIRLHLDREPMGADA
ncbi:cytochrome P450 [Gordonia hydrophobica]|uniref:Cytochrome P450 n=1 Tax=Gordonia hydrophobica TaxID=40516 RepID=A0ABZ2U686_9ACTN|nr:cytochrome P450 [Gordonia hydrophobica]MBM7365467.1 cytochrome P450 [Gordonia hydrophobica]